MAPRKTIAWVAASGVVLVIMALLAYRLSGSTAVESWVGSQLLEIGGGYLEPTLHFDRLTYVRPRTIVLDNLTLSSPDSANPGRKVVILAVKRATLELTEIPRRGQPIRFSDVILESPELHAVAATQGGGALVGFSHFVKHPANSQGAQNVATTAGAGSAPSSPPMKLSDFLLIRRIQIRNGIVRYDPRVQGMPPIWLDGINSELDFTPADGGQNPGLYALQTTISRAPAFALTVQGSVDIDAWTLTLAKLDSTLDLREKNAHFLPPELQKFLQSFEVTGALHVTAEGTVPLHDWRQSVLQTTGVLTGAQVAMGSNRLVIDAWNWKADSAAGVVSIRQADGRLLGGTVQATGTIPLDGTGEARLDATAEQLHIQRLLRDLKPNEVPQYAGNVSARVSYSAPPAFWNTQARGGGTFSIRQGKIDRLPVLGTIVTTLSQSLAHSINANQDLSDSADGRFSFAGNGLRIDDFTGTSGAMALRATGTVGFDQRLELRLNGGPMEGLQNSLGGLGRAWASMSDAMAGYRVTGTLGAPEVSMEFGGGR